MNNELLYSYDIGTSSIGWSIRDLNNNRIVDLGVRLFDIPEKGKERRTSCSIRSEQRALRRLLKRKKKRIYNIKQLIINNGLLTEDEVKSLYEFNGFIEDIYKLRAVALDERIDNFQLSRLLLFFAKNRGYKSNAKVDVLMELVPNVSNDNLESKKMLSAIASNKELLVEKSYRTVGEMLYKDEKFKDKKKNTTNQYISCVSREDVIDEIKYIISAQRELGNEKLTAELEEKYVEIIRNQLPFLLKKDMDKMIGKCSLIQGEQRAAKNSYTFERFVLLSKLNNLSIEGNKLSIDDRQAIVDLVYKQKTVKFANIRKLLKIDNELKFNLVDYNKHASLEEAEKSVFVELNGFHSLKKVFSNNKEVWSSISQNEDLMDEIAHTISTCKDYTEFKEHMLKLVDEEYLVPLFSLDFSKFGNLSIKAIKKLLPFMEEGNVYYNACIKAGLNPDGYSSSVEKKLKIDADIYNELSNSRIIRIISEFRKVYNNMVSTYGAPKEVNIEVAREVTLSKKKKDKLKKEQAANEKLNKLLIEEFLDSFGRKPTFKEKIKFKLWKEQNKLCMYSGKEIPAGYIIDDSKLEIDHAIHISLSGDDSMNNKVLVLKKENQNKGARTPYQYLSDEDKWNAYIERVNNSSFNLVKKNKLKNKTFDTNFGFINRYLNDTREVSIFLYRYIKNNLIGYNGEDIKVRCVSGAVTSFLRSIWGIPKDRDNVYHHIEDSLLVGCCDAKFINQVSKLAKKDILYKEKESASENILSSFPLPYEYFIDEMKARLSKSPSINIHKLVKEYNLDVYSEKDISRLNVIYPSFKLSRKIQGQIHPETIRSKKGVDIKPNYVQVRNGITNSAVFVRIDIFKVNGKYKIVPVYRHQLTKGLSNISIGSNSDISKLIVKDEDFIFSLFKNDTIVFETKNSEVFFASYISTDSSTGAIKVKLFEDGCLVEKRLGIVNLNSLEKVEVDVLGKMHKLKFKPRENINIKALK